MTAMKFEFATSEQRAAIRKQLGTSEDEIQQSLATLRDWLQAQPHLPDTIDDRVLEGMYIGCKCSTERVKKSLDAYFSLKHKVPELLMKRDPLGADVQESKEIMKIMGMPRLTADGYRVAVLVDLNPDPEKLDVPKLMRVGLMWMEIARLLDYFVGAILVLDFKNVTAAHLPKIGLNNLRIAETLYRTAYCTRVKSIHIVNAPKIIDMALTVVKSALSPKLGERVMAHLEGSDTVFQCVPREFIPNELGGTGGPVDEIHDASYAIMYPYRDWLLEQDRYLSDESKRPPGTAIVNDMFGMEGSFKKLSVD
ncbi:alpha-tocopherol transfer protein-like isoform X1 [Schistocerca nitens]|uniref:alpha-tocopherol transfer protein-like isoform X1 n=2 Tax=Schistocerca nitens TaxID=7011 RepID=UPI0021191469|nr:alpha-tocopherol transfer protein-like isoform X1 [Schistocerca nitens]